MMNRMQTDDNSSSGSKRDLTNYGYESSYTTYHSSSPSSIGVNQQQQQQQQPLPGQPPLPPMPPPPPGPLTPMSHVYPTMSQLSQLPQVTWTSAWSPHWITAQPPGLPSQPQRDLAAAAAAAAAAVSNVQANNARATYNRRRYNIPHNNNPIYSPNNRNNNNFNRNKNRRQPASPQQQQQQQQANSWFNQVSQQQHGNYGNQNNDILIPLTPTIATDKKDSFDQDIKIVSEISVKKSKQRKPMSQNYPSRPWNLKDAEAALAVEQDHNQRVRAQSLIIKFPDPDLNKQVVGKFHDGIKNIHFQSPSGPRYCFVQMAENVNIDEAIKELEKIPFGSGYLKVERKSMKKEEEDLRPEIIDPYTLYVGNLPESVNVNELKSKFPTATRVDVGYAQKMRNTRYAFVRYSTVEDSIAVYKSSQDLMWDTRSTIVRFRRDKKNKVPPSEAERSLKKVKVDPDNDDVVKKEEQVTACSQAIDKVCGKKPDDLLSKSAVDNHQILTATQVNPIGNNFEGMEMITTIKEEPIEALDDESYLSMNDDDSDDENDIPDEMDDINDEIDDDDGVDNGNDEDDDDDNDLLDNLMQSRRDDGKKTDSTDNLDPIFNQLGNISDIEL